MIRKAPPKPPKLVVCAECRHFRRDTTGPSYSLETHEYFMGECDKGCDPDRTFNKARGTAKVFANKKRQCRNYGAGENGSMK